MSGQPSDRANVDRALGFTVGLLKQLVKEGKLSARRYQDTLEYLKVEYGVEMPATFRLEDGE